MNMKLMTLLALPLLALTGAAMPTKAELDAVTPVVADLMKPEQAALKTGAKTKSEVAAAALKLVDAADSEAAKLLLAKGAYNLYVRDGDFEKAIETLQTMREKVVDLEPKYLANIIESSLRTISRKHGGQLYQLLDETRACVRYQTGLKNLEAELKKNPSDKNLNLKLAEHHAILGDWPSALDAFERSYDRKAAEAATAEKTGAKVLKPHADYWWDYPNRKAPEYAKPFRQHAAKLYAQAIATGEISGLHKIQADRRIAEAAAMGAPACAKAEKTMIAKDLLHRWSFTDNLKDSVSGLEAEKFGKVTVTNGSCVLDRGRIELNAVAEELTDRSFTIEIWYTELGRTYGPRVVELSGTGGRYIGWAAGCQNEGYFYAQRVQPGRGTEGMQFELQQKTYIAISYEARSRTVRAYKSDANGGKMLSWTAEIADPYNSFQKFALGCSCNSRMPQAAYDEVRIWTRVLSEEELIRSVSCGPNKLPDIKESTTKTDRGIRKNISRELESSGGVQLWENGPYWAECNVGATKPEESGYYFWWGDTVGYKRVGDRWDAVDGSRTGFSFNDKNCPTSGKDKAQLRVAGYIDATGNLTSAHDAATAHLGAPWRMPTDADFVALIKNCDTEWTTCNGVAGRLVKGKGAFVGKSIFLPAAGYGRDSYLSSAGSHGIYWSSTPRLDYSNNAWYLYFISGNFYRRSISRYDGRSVRPLRGPVQTSSGPRLSQNSANAAVQTVQSEPETKVAAQRELAKERAARDVGVYGEAMKEIESLYLAFSKTGDKQAFKSLVSKYPKTNRAGCAALYVAQRMQGARQVAALTEVIEKFGDCYYGDGCNVGALARYYLVRALLNQGDKARAKTVADELRRNYSDAIGHDGALIVDNL